MAPTRPARRISAPLCSTRWAAPSTTGQDAETKAAHAIQGGGSLTEVVTAISRAELALQSATAIRDRVVQAYQDIMKMPI